VRVWALISQTSSCIYVTGYPCHAPSTYNRTLQQLLISNKLLQWLLVTHCKTKISNPRRVAPYTPTRSCVHIGVLKKNKEQKKYGRQTTRANRPADTPKQYWKVSLYYAFIDHMIMEWESRLIKSENRFYAQYLLPHVIGNITNEQIATLYETYQTDLTCNLDEFKREIARWRTRWNITPHDQMPTSLCETLDAVNPVLYPSIDTILCIILTMLVTSATAERSFSVLRRWRHMYDQQWITIGCHR
jgi:hypothetical protein